MVDKQKAQLFFRQAVALAKARNAEHPEQVKLLSDAVCDALHWPPEDHGSLHNDVDDIVLYLRDMGKVVIEGTTTGTVPFRMLHQFRLTGRDLQ